MLPKASHCDNNGVDNALWISSGITTERDGYYLTTTPLRA